MMNDEPLNEKPDLSLKNISKQDLYALSIKDLEERIDALKNEILRCEQAMKDRGDTRTEAEKLFKI